MKSTGFENALANDRVIRDVRVVSVPNVVLARVVSVNFIYSRLL